MAIASRKWPDPNPSHQWLYKKRHYSWPLLQRRPTPNLTILLVLRVTGHFSVSMGDRVNISKFAVSAKIVIR